MDFAKKLGADYTLLVKSRDGKETADQVEDLMGEKAEITIECSGVAQSIQTAIYVSRRASVCSLVRYCYNGMWKVMISMTGTEQGIFCMRL